MAYTKQNFENGQILTAEQLNHMEQGIAAPDWHDVTNKPFYDLEPWIPPVTLPEPGAESMIIRNHMISASATDKVCWIKENTKYVVNLNGTDYECESFTISNPQFKGNVCLGNQSILLPLAGNGMPFLLISNTNLSPAGTDVFLEDDSLTSCTISIRLADEPTIKHLDPKYIKDMYYDYEIDELPLTETMLTDGSAELAEGFMLIGGAEYKVRFNGQSYICTAVDFSSLGGIIFLGNDNLMGNESSRTEPFCIVSSFDTSSSTLMVNDTSAYSCSIAVTRLEAQKIPQRFMPWSPQTGNALYWDGSIIDSDVTVVPGDTGGQIFIKVSDIVPTEEELKEGITLTEYVDGSEICTYVPGPVTYSSDGTIWLGVLRPTAVIVRTPSQDGALTEGIYFIVTKAELGADLMEFRAGAITVHALHRFTSCPTLHGSAMPKYLDTLCVDRIVFRSPLGRLYALSVSDNGATVFKEVGTAQ